MIQIALKLGRLPANEVKTLARSVNGGITDSGAFPNRKVPPEEIEASVKAVEEQEATVGVVLATLRAERASLRQKVRTLKTLLRAATADCESTVSTLPEAQARAALRSAHIPLRADNAPTAPATRPENLDVQRDAHDGSVKGRCKRVRTARLYRVRAARTPDGPWEIKCEGTKARFSIRDLAPGEWFFEMAAIGVNGGWSGWSDVARCVVV